MRQVSGSLNVLRSLPSSLHRPASGPVDHYLGPILADGPGSEVIGARVETSFGRGRGSSPATRYPAPLLDPLVSPPCVRASCGSIASNYDIFAHNGHLCSASAEQRDDEAIGYPLNARRSSRGRRQGS